MKDGQLYASARGCPPIGSMILAHIRNEEYDPPEKK